MVALRAERFEESNRDRRQETPKTRRIPLETRQGPSSSGKGASWERTQGIMGQDRCYAFDKAQDFCRDCPEKKVQSEGSSENAKK